LPLLQFSVVVVVVVVFNIIIISCCRRCNVHDIVAVSFSDLDRVQHVVYLIGALVGRVTVAHHIIMQNLHKLKLN